MYEYLPNYLHSWPFPRDISAFSPHFHSFQKPGQSLSSFGIAPHSNEVQSTPNTSKEYRIILAREGKVKFRHSRKWSKIFNKGNRIIFINHYPEIIP